MQPVRKQRTPTHCEHWQVTLRATYYSQSYKGPVSRIIRYKINKAEWSFINLATFEYLTT